MTIQNKSTTAQYGSGEVKPSYPDMPRAEPSSSVDEALHQMSEAHWYGFPGYREGFYAGFNAAHRGPVAQEAPEPSDEDWNIRKYIDFLRADEGDSVTLFCDNPDFNGQPNCAIECNGYWTNWQDRRFAADTLQGALELAYFECREWRANPPPEVSPDPLPAYADQNFKYDMETGTYRRISGASSVPSTKRVCPNGLDHGNCGFPDCVSSCPGRLSLSSPEGK